VLLARGMLVGLPGLLVIDMPGGKAESPGRAWCAYGQLFPEPPPLRSREKGNIHSAEKHWTYLLVAAATHSHKCSIALCDGVRVSRVWINSNIPTPKHFNRLEYREFGVRNQRKDNVVTDFIP